jgi:hypothetical protein
VSHRAGRKCSNYLFSLQLDHPTLKRNDIVVMVNHKVSGMKEGTEAAVQQCSICRSTRWT